MLASFIAASAGTVVTDVTTNVASKVSLDCMDKEWKGPLDVTQHIRQLAESRATLGFNRDLDRPAYAKSPLLRRLEQLPLAPEIVYVAYVPPGNGKTTACRAFLRALKRKPRGIAFCPSQADPPYAREMVKFLDLDANDPPDGWLICLKNDINNKGERTYLLLDDFMSSGPNDFDRRLIESVKSTIRGRILLP